MIKSNVTAFLSYKWADDESNKWVEMFACDLRKCGIDVKLDKWEVRYGESFTDYMTSQIQSSDVFLFVITEESKKAIEGRCSAGAVRFEIQLASALRIQGHPQRFIGIWRGAEKPPAHLLDFRCADFRNDSSYKESIHLLAEDLLDRKKAPRLGEKEYFLANTEWIATRNEVNPSDRSGSSGFVLRFLTGGKLYWVHEIDEGFCYTEIYQDNNKENSWEQSYNTVSCVMNGVRDSLTGVLEDMEFKTGLNNYWIGGSVKTKVLKCQLIECGQSTKVIFYFSRNLND
jgi:hypothetical protein